MNGNFTTLYRACNHVECPCTDPDTEYYFSVVFKLWWIDKVKISYPGIAEMNDKPLSLTIRNLSCWNITPQKRKVDSWEIKVISVVIQS